MGPYGNDFGNYPKSHKVDVILGEMMSEDKEYNIVLMKDVIMKMKQNAKGYWIAEVRVQNNDVVETANMMQEALDHITAETMRRNIDES